MRSPTLHRLLWGASPEGGSLDRWKIRPWESPAVGLPARVAVFLFCCARRSGPPAGWEASRGPLTWVLRDRNDLLAKGRLSQFGFGSEERPAAGAECRCGVESSSEKWEVPPHPAYFLPFAEGPMQDMDDAYRLYCDVLLLLTAMDGGEAILDSFVQRGAGIVPFEDRWDWRSRIHFPAEAWKLVEAVIRRSGLLETNGAPIDEGIVDALGPLHPRELRFEDFGFERIDIVLDPGADAEVVRAVRRHGTDRHDLPRELLVRDDELADQLVIRIAQTEQWPRREQVTRQFPRVDAGTSSRIMEQVARAFHYPKQSETHGEPELVLLPEVSVPLREVQTVRDLAASTGRASLAGLYWRQLRPVYPNRGGVSPRRRWFVNEAELAVPLGYEGRGPSSVRWFRIRKPVPARVETGLAQALDRLNPGVCWTVMEGRRWYRFVHPKWGDFTIAICADLIDPSPWHALRGELLHLLMVGFNRDVKFFEGLTWVRAYENYVNLVAVNHGKYGGSFAWTPKRRHLRDMATLRGGRIFLVADVGVPVKDLFRAQRTAGASATESASNSWLERKSLSSDFKSPPPGYVRSARL